MTITEAVRLLRKLKAYKPQQDIDELTPEAWQEALGEYAYADVDRALSELVAEIPWVGVEDVKKRVKHYRAERIDHGYADLLIPSGLNPAEFTDWSRQVRKRLAAGETALSINDGMTFDQLPQHNVLELMGRRQ